MQTSELPILLDLSQRWQQLQKLLIQSGPDRTPPSPYWHQPDLFISLYPINPTWQLSDVKQFILQLLQTMDNALNLTYHNKQHALSVLDRFYHLIQNHNINIPDLHVIIAALMHDYSPHNFPFQPQISNELIAATEADFLAAHLDLSPADRHQIQDMIISTRMDQEPVSFIGSLLHAADLAGYIKPWPDWVAESAALIHEIGIDTLNLHTLNDWVKFSLNFLHLAKSRTFHLIPPLWQKALEDKINILTHLQPSHPTFTPVKTHILPLLT